ncbi:hypothetical protein JCM8547_007168 [Rhodosporidiobolus lusitaniae]
MAAVASLAADALPSTAELASLVSTSLHTALSSWSTGDAPAIANATSSSTSSSSENGSSEDLPPVLSAFAYSCLLIVVALFFGGFV